MKFVSLRAEIRDIADRAGGPAARLGATEIYARVTRRNVSLDNFYVTLGQMVIDKQMDSHGDKKPYQYSSGTEPVDMTKEYRPERSRLKGFRQLAREDEARKRGGG